MKLSILLPHYHEAAQPFLSACLRSLSKQTFKDFETILLSSNHMPQGNFYGVVDKQFHSSTRLHFPGAIEKAYEMSDPSSEFLLLLNDDAILAKDCLQKLIETISANQNMILGARSNCGPIMGWYDTNMAFISDGKFHRLGPQFRYKEIEPFIDDMIEHNVSYPFGVFKIPFSPFFCSMIRRSDYEKVGKIDAAFLSGSDDLDFAIRAQKHFIHCYVALHAACYHASGVSADLGLTQADRDFNKVYLEQKLNPR